MMAALAALLAPATAAEAAKKRTVKKPVITKITPMKAEVGDTLSIHGKYFRKGFEKNTVVFKRDGARAVFVKAGVSTKKLIRVKLPETLVPHMANVGTTKVATRFRIRVLAQRFGKSFTSARRSPLIGPDTPPPPPPPPSAADVDGDCDGDGIRNGRETDADNDGLRDDVELSLKLDPCMVDTDKDGLEDRWEFDCDRNGVLNRDQLDDDSDLLDDVTENALGLNGCVADSDGDLVEDGYEYQSARDLNDDRYQDADSALPYPGKRPYANPLFADANDDHDGDGLWLIDEFRLWQRYGVRSLDNLVYSDGKQYSRDINTVGYVKQGEFLSKAASQGYSAELLLNMDSIDQGDDDAWWFKDTSVDAPADDFYAPNPQITDVERYYYDIDYDGKLSDDELDEDADGLTNWVEAHGWMNPTWWTHVLDREKPYIIEYAGTDLVDPDSDGDTVIDGADDQDHDDIPNVRELRRQLIAGEVPAGAPNYCAVADDRVPLDPNLDDPQTWPVYETFQMGDSKFSICCNRPQEGNKQEPIDSAPDRAWVNPFNPCLPNVLSRTCERYLNLSELYAPFEESTPVFKVVDGHLKNME